jgi:hypothetical protein
MDEFHARIILCSKVRINATKASRMERKEFSLRGDDSIYGFNSLEVAHPLRVRLKSVDERLAEMTREVEGIIQWKGWFLE